jgi:drug/metabolite transporter (DMT)-like permease
VSLQNALLLALNVLALSVGQVLFKLAAAGFDGSESFLRQLLMNKYLFAALAVYGLATAMWVALLRQVPLHVAYPFVALAFFFVPLMAHWVLGEPLRWQTLAGAAVIFAGVWISGLE